MAIDTIRRRFGSHSLVRLRRDQVNQRHPISLRQSLPAWWPHETPTWLIEIAGGNHPGGLSLVLLWLAACSSNGPIAWIDTPEVSRLPTGARAPTGRQTGRLFPPSLAAAGIDLRRLIVVRPTTSDIALNAATLLLRSEGFDVVLLPLRTGEQLPAMVASKLALLARQSRSTLVVLECTSEESAPRLTAEHGTSKLVGQSDFRLRPLACEWLWRDRELQGARLRIRTEKARVGLAPIEHEFVLGLRRRGRDDTIVDHLALESCQLVSSQPTSHATANLAEPTLAALATLR
ncbi:MAG TPA: hypothetical protein VMP10_01915 [Chloroflexota bacterium]|nr:hypothetical protein [Chloroflexota bacterium]